MNIYYAPNATKYQQKTARQIIETRRPYQTPCKMGRTEWMLLEYMTYTGERYIVAFIWSGKPVGGRWEKVAATMNIWED